MAHPLHSLTALFDTPDAIVRAADETSKRGFTRFDVHTPYPVHGMDRAMRLRPSRMGFFALAFGLLGAISSVGLMTWITLVDYPLVIGGKPFWSWPAFVPVAFEITVLLASVLSVAAMVVLYFKFPNTSHPLHDTLYMKRVSSDRFGLCIMADDPAFTEEEVRLFLEKIGGKEIAPVHFIPEELDHGQKLFDPRFLGVLALTALVVVAGTYVTLNHLLYMEPFSWMMHQNKLKAQAPSELFPHGIGMRKPVEGTVARGFLPYPYHGNPEAAGKGLVNPVPGTKEVLARGKEKFLTFCSPCHGNLGGGESRLRGQFPNPPTLHSDKLRTWPDGNLYHVITEGQNVMPRYAAQIPRDDRWAIVHYVRALERAHNAKESDLR
jgi:mono/diheme cytochrome c family protein